MKNLVNCLAKHLGELVLVGGAAVVAVGAGMIRSARGPDHRGQPGHRRRGAVPVGSG